MTGLLLFALGCGESDDLLDDTGDTASCGQRVTWDTFGAGFTRNYCQICHASTAPDRHGAPENVVFDTEDQALALADTILTVATGDDPLMPPGGGVPDDDRALLACWLSASRDGR